MGSRWAIWYAQPGDVARDRITSWYLTTGAPGSQVTYCMGGLKASRRVPAILEGETGSLAAIISEGQAFANRGYQADHFRNDPTKFAD